MNTRAISYLASAVVVPLAALAACNASPPEPLPTKESAPAQTQAAQASQPGQVATSRPASTPAPPMTPPKRKVSAKPVATVPVSEADPLKGKWTLEDATKGLPPGKEIVATIETDLGTMTCKLFADKAPITVANFVGLARGGRPFKNKDGKWEKKPAYDGTTFHRIIKGFMIQGGDTAHEEGKGEAGYVIPDEIWDDANHDRAGLLCMANRGPNTNSAQFFITDAAAHHLDNGYTIFGECSPEAVVHEIASVPVKRDKPEKAPVIKKITVTRK